MPREWTTATRNPHATPARQPGRRTVPVIRVQALADTIIELTLQDAHTARTARPGQFVMLYTHDQSRLMPRPFGVAGTNGDTFTIIFAIVGEGTRQFSILREGDTIDMLGPLGGQAFNLDQPGDYLLVGGGLGIPPLLYAAQHLAAKPDTRTTAILGYRDTRYADTRMQTHTPHTHSITNAQGDVLTLLNTLEPNPNPDQPLTILTCGPKPMMQAVHQWAQTHNANCQTCMEQRMGCGYGACVACTIPTIHGNTKTCTEGPVFPSTTIIW